MPSNVVSFDSYTANMYGCEPCPKCGSKFRYVMADTPKQIDCDDCGFKERVVEAG